ncbi:b(0,+)-type amino acid transporter 1-like [Centruroides sculpturatus]|uniref:b(0,+)-type amino acid transporter 1-like n=1 Tax=Centruroides sculpturatus TaxID=218467 RepID=UPI000C6EDA3A|nr:b(0,+)-type amino acid transporter 1-like [Centruroides sculpturatus]
MASYSPVNTELSKLGSNPSEKKSNSKSLLPQNNAENKGVELKREMGLISAVGLIVGGMIGSGIFISPKGVLERSGSVSICLLIIFSGALCYAELGTIIPMSGGEYAYLLKTFGRMGHAGPIPAFLYIWTCVFLMKPAAFAIMCLTFAEYVVEPLYPNCDSPTVVKKLTACLCISLIAFINCYSVKLATRIQNIFTAVKLLAVVIIVIGGAVKMAEGNTQNLVPDFEHATTSFSNIATAFYFGLWAYEGWNYINYVTEELVNPYVNLPRAIIIAIPLVTLCYVFTNIAYLAAMSPAELLASDVVAVKFAARVLGPAAVIIPIFVAFSAYGAGNASCFTTGRLSFVAAREGHLVDVLSYIHIHKLTPMPALMFNAFLTICMVAVGNISSLIDFFSFAAWLFYGGTTLSVIVLRWTMKDIPRPYKVPIVIPVIVLIVSLYLVIAPILQNPAIEYLYASLFIFSGVIVYIPFVHYKIQLKIMDKVTYFLQLMFSVVPTHSYPE